MITNDNNAHYDIDTLYIDTGNVRLLNIHTWNDVTMEYQARSQGVDVVHVKPLFGEPPENPLLS